MRILMSMLAIAMYMAALQFTMSRPAIANNTAEPIVLTVHHFLSVRSTTHTRMIEPWTKAIEEASDGRLRFEIFPSMSLGGKPGDLADQVVDGSADIVWTLPGYTPGRFPRAEVFELPTVHNGSALETNRAIQATLPLLQDDFAGLHLLTLHVHGGNALHMVDKEPASLADFKGLKLRTPSRTGAWMIEALNAEPVAMPVPALPQALSRKAIDGALIPFEIALPLRVHELTRYHLERADGRRFGTSLFLFAMNSERYASLPDDLKATIDLESSKLSESMGALWDQVEADVMAVTAERGNTIVQLTAAESESIDEALAGVEAKWLDDAATRGVDGVALIGAARSAYTTQSTE